MLVQRISSGVCLSTQLILSPGLQSIDTRIHESFFLQDSFLFWFWQLYSHLENKHQQPLCLLCETLQGDLFSSCHDSTAFLGTFFFPCGSWYQLTHTDFPQPSPHPATLGVFSNLCFYLSTLWVLEQNYASLHLRIPRLKDYSKSQALGSFSTFIIEFGLSEIADPT